jgi:hypothetical protein
MPGRFGMVFELGWKHRSVKKTPLPLLPSMNAGLFRFFGFLLLVVGIPFRFNPRITLPQFYETTGGFEKSPAGQVYFAFIDLTNMAIFFGALMVVLSFTTLVRSAGQKPKEKPEQSSGANG